MRERTKKYISMDTAVYMYDPESPYFITALFDYQIDKIVLKDVGPYVFHNDCAKGNIFDWSELVRQICRDLKLCSTADLGLDEDPIITKSDHFSWNIPISGFSVRTLYHFAQQVRGGGLLNQKIFRKFDYGHDGNMQAYGTPVPPSWEFGGYHVDSLFAISGTDWVTPPSGANYLVDTIRDQTKNQEKKPDLRCYRNKDWFHGDPYKGMNVTFRDVVDRFIRGTLEDDDNLC